MRRLTTEMVLQRLGFKSRETLRSMVKDGKIAPPMKDEGSSLNFWLEDDVDDYLRQFAERRRKAAEDKAQQIATQIAA